MDFVDKSQFSLPRTPTISIGRTLRLPKKILVNGEEWTVKRRSLKHQVVIRGRIVHKKYFGLTDFKRKIITISWGLPDDQLLSTFVHEICHAVVYDLDEEAVRRLEHALMYALRRIEN